MKNMTLFLSLLFAGTVFGAPVHLDLEMSSAEYQSILKQVSPTKSLRPEDPAITKALQLGERLSKWIALVNSGRTPETAIRLTSPTTRRGIPIDKPNMYSPEIIKKDTDTVLSELPKEMKDVLLSTGDLPGVIPFDDEKFINFARKVDKNYQSAARYKTVDAYRSEYIDEAMRDVRGYHYLMINKIEEGELRDITVIPAEKLAAIRDALTMVCLNSLRNGTKCKHKIEEAFKRNNVSTFYKKHIFNAKKVWDEFFKIPRSARRRDIHWKSNIATVPFNNPEIPKFGPYLQNNIEDEFRWKGWELKIKFGSYARGPYLTFEPNVVPHVNGLGGNEIVMDSNQPIEEYESQWTIRHEFGHVLGLPDCYHEFYDVKAQAYVNYQLDITDLMCSRAGNMKERIYNELKGAYAK